MEWGRPENFIWFWATPASALLFLLASWRKKRELARFGDPDLVGRLVQALDRRARLAKHALIFSALCLMVAALAQPHFRRSESKVERRGIDVIIAVDVSNSMLAKDIAPNRLEKAKLELAGLIDKLKGNRLGVIAFAGDAVIQCPLTLDRAAVKMLLSAVSPNIITFQGTDLGRAIAVSLQAFQDKTKDSKALILLTDGEDHGKETPQIVKRAKDAGVRIFTIGIGTSDGSPLPDEFGQGPKKDRSGKVILSKLGEPALQRIARDTGGAYFHSARGDLEAVGIERAISTIATKGFKSDWTVEYEENFRFFLLAAFLFLMTEMFLSEGRRSAR